MSDKEEREEMEKNTVVESNEEPAPAATPGQNEKKDEKTDEKPEAKSGETPEKKEESDDKTGGEAPPGETPTEDAGEKPGEEKPGTKKDPVPPGVEKSLARMRRRQGEAERERDAAHKELAGIKAAQAEADKKAEEKKDELVEPEEADFASYSEYHQALRAFDKAVAKKDAEQLFAESTKAATEKKVEDTEAAVVEVRRAAFGEQIEAAIEEHPDFAELCLEGAGLEITREMGEAMEESKVGAAIFYKLGKDPAEASRIAALPRLQQVMAIGRLEASITKTPAKTETTKTPGAPPPIASVSGAGASPDIDPDSMTDKQFIEMREKQAK